MITTADIKSKTVAEELKSGTPAGVKLLHDINEAAAMLNISVVSVRKLIRQNRLRRVANFRKVLIPAAELQRFAE